MQVHAHLGNVRSDLLGDGDPFFKDHVQGAVERGLAARGVELTSSNPDLLIHYHANISDDIDPAFGLSSEQGVEAYYNIEITPWCHLSPDLQVIVDPGGTSKQDVAVVYGLRMQMSL